MHILLTLIAIALAMLLLCVRVLAKKNGRFSSEHISQNKRMRERGIHCATSQDREQRAKAQRQVNVKEL